MKIQKIKFQQKVERLQNLIKQDYLKWSSNPDLTPVMNFINWENSSFTVSLYLNGNPTMTWPFGNNKIAEKNTTCKIEFDKAIESLKWVLDFGVSIRYVWDNGSSIGPTYIQRPKIVLV